jgi:phosphonoacetaldehyde hydrolase
MASLKGVYAEGVRAIVADLAGTTVDYGSCAPAGVFVQVFRNAGVELSLAEARGPMGMGKKDHIRELFRLPRVTEAWRAAKGRDWSEADVIVLYEAFIPLQLNCLADYNNLIPGVYQTVSELQQDGIQLGVNTGYTREMTQIVLDGMRQQGVVPRAVSCLSDVPAGRPAPWMIFDTMEQLGVFPPAAVIVIGDTLSDIEAGRNAGAWTVGVTRTGNLVGMTSTEIHLAEPSLVAAKVAEAEAIMRAMGADYVVDSFADLPQLIDKINLRLGAGERP